jgi:DnaJ like chaperone protein
MVRQGISGDLSEKRQWYETLDVDQTATMEEIKAAYRTKIKQYHPDRVENLAPELKALAQNRTQEINTAYEIARRLRQ